jgi:uncharacterized coiled-coil protein SlyX
MSETVEGLPIVSVLVGRESQRREGFVVYDCTGVRRELLDPDGSPVVLASHVQKLVGELRLAMLRVGDRKMWRTVNGELVWRGMAGDGNEIETEDPRDIIEAALRLVPGPDPDPEPAPDPLRSLEQRVAELETHLRNPEKEREALEATVAILRQRNAQQADLIRRCQDQLRARTEAHSPEGEPGGATVEGAVYGLEFDAGQNVMWVQLSISGPGFPFQLGTPVRLSQVAGGEHGL